MRQIGKFKGLSVFVVDRSEWLEMNSNTDEKIYVVNNDVFYHDEKIATVNYRNQLCDFDESRFEHLRNYYEKKRQDAARRESALKDTMERIERERAEERLGEEEKLESETVEAGVGTVDSFMASWRDKIDQEIDRMKQVTDGIGEKLNEIG